MTLVAALCILLIAAILPGCREIQIGSGNLQTQSFTYADFARVEISAAFNVEIEQSSTYSVQITMDDNAFDYLEISKIGDTLRIGMKTLNMFRSLTLQARITTPELRSLVLSGASRVNISGFNSRGELEIESSGASLVEIMDISCGDLEIALSGASTLKGDIECADAELELSGASQMQLDGLARDVVMDVSGFSHADLADFALANAVVDLSGASTCSINLSGRLDADLSGASKLEYLGNPAMGEINTSGASSIISK